MIRTSASPTSLIATLAVFNPGEGDSWKMYGIVRVGVDGTDGMGYRPLQMSVSGVFSREVVVLSLTVNTPVSCHRFALSCQQLELLLAGGDIEDGDGPVGLLVHYFISRVGLLVITDTAQELILHHSSVQQTSLTLSQCHNVTMSQRYNVTM